jgi:glutaredoxin 3
MSNATAGAQPKPIKIYVTDYCPYCVRAKRLLDKKGWPYQEINVEGDAEARAWLVKVTGRRTVPQIFIGDEPVGGSDDIHAMDRAGELDKMVLGG